jgi:hypothetical protein
MMMGVRVANGPEFLVVAEVEEAEAVYRKVSVTCFLI